MQTFIFLIIILISIVNLQAEEISIEQFRWENRLVIYYISEDELEKYDMPKMVLENKDKVIDRDMLFFDLNQKDKGDYFMSLSASESKRLIDKYKIEPGKTAFILIGKDGGEKERLSEPNVDYFFNKIDQMPMRINEMNGL
ncbi:MAG: DUF4174 domain-containing protein [Thermodesulfobacteriota bacterium]